MILVFYNNIVLIMEIPDLDFKTPATLQPMMDVVDFYSLEASQLSQEKPQTTDQSPYDRDFEPILQDEIQKKTMNVSWHSRYFCLTPTRILYYESVHKRVLKGCFNLASLLKHSLQMKEQQSKLIFSVVISSDEQNKQVEEKQILVLNFEQILPRLAVWKDQINKAFIRISLSKIEFPLISVEQIRNPHLKIHGDNYWNRIYLTNNEMVNYVHQLDIIFFRSKSPMASFHRFLMRSNFDHVGILLKDSHNRLLVLEAIQSRGVWINEWNQMLPSFQEHYEEIAIKKLVANELKIDFQMLQAYLDAVIGKKYQLSLSKLIIGQNSSLNSDFVGNFQGKSKVKNLQAQIENQQIKQKTFFCSELIADIFIKCGFIKGKKKNEFWPRDFEGDSLQLESHVSLSPLMYLSF